MAQLIMQSGNWKDRLGISSYSPVKEAKTKPALALFDKVCRSIIVRVTINAVDRIAFFNTEAERSTV